MATGPATRIKGQMETRFCREESWAVNRHTACTEPSWDGEWRRNREPQSCGSHRAVALEGVMSFVGTQTQPRGLPSLTNPGGEMPGLTW